MWSLFLLLSACPGGLKSNLGDSAGTGGCDLSATALPATCACEDPVVLVGGGEDTFQAVADGSSVTMVHGPQGGWHVLGSAQFANLNPIVTIHYTITVQPEGVLVSDNTYRVQMVQDAECTGFYPGMYGYLDVTELADGDLDTPPELLGDHELALEMVVTDTEGRVATDILTTIAELDPVDVAAGDTGVDTGVP